MTSIYIVAGKCPMRTIFISYYNPGKCHKGKIHAGKCHAGKIHPGKCQAGKYHRTVLFYKGKWSSLFSEEEKKI